MIFIDGSNMYHSLKSYFKRTDVDLALFNQKLLEKRRLVRVYYYNAVVGKVEEPERFKDQEKYFQIVASIPYTELRLGRLVYTNAWPNSPPFEKGVDVQLATDMITHAYKNNYDVAILVAGDNDYVGAMQAVKDNGKHVEVALFGQERTSRQLRDVADRVIPIDGYLMRGCWKSQLHHARYPQQPSFQPQRHFDTRREDSLEAPPIESYNEWNYMRFEE
ncbi:MAG: NYN domain-containing protein [Dehalococcoidia bacterium]|nr:NYN domain-containing protein [Dehalococcoidia bacterium]